MTRLLDGRELGAGAEPLTEHLARHGPVPRLGGDFIETLSRSGLVGRGGAGFPAGAKWKSVAAHSHGQAVVVVNGAEGEPQSKKDQVLMASRPHLILDGAFIAARVVRARQVILYIGEDKIAGRNAMVQALAERPDAEQRITRLAAAPQRYVAGESSAVVHLLREGIATPTTTPPSPHERGVDGAATLVQNVETLAHVALIARGKPAGSVLLTVVGGVARPGVMEADVRNTVGQVVESAGANQESARAILIGGYFGTWSDPAGVWDRALDPLALRADGIALGCGVIGVLSKDRCPVCETSGIMHYLASESSAQCGPCFFGLRALSAACSRIAHQGSNTADMDHLRRWTSEVRGRGACRHPDGAVLFLESALRVFAPEFANHAPHNVRRTA